MPCRRVVQEYGGKKKKKKKKKELFYLTTHSTHFITVGETGNPLPPLHGLLFPIISKRLLYALANRQHNKHHNLRNTSRGVLVGMGNVPRIDPPKSFEPTHRAQMPLNTPLNYLSRDF